MQYLYLLLKQLIETHNHIRERLKHYFRRLKSFFRNFKLIIVFVRKKLSHLHPQLLKRFFVLRILCFYEFSCCEIFIVFLSRIYSSTLSCSFQTKCKYVADYSFIYRKGNQQDKVSTLKGPWMLS